jgi:hypothetical protein
MAAYGDGKIMLHVVYNRGWLVSLHNAANQRLPKLLTQADPVLINYI